MFLCGQISLLGVSSPYALKYFSCLLTLQPNLLLKSDDYETEEDLTEAIIAVLGGEHHYTYYFSINATNAASKDAELRWHGVSGDEQLVVWRNSTSEKESVVIGSTVPEPFLITAYEKGTSTTLLINGMESLSIPLSLNKKTTYLLITDGEYSVCTYFMFNEFL